MVRVSQRLLESEDTGLGKDFGPALSPTPSSKHLLLGRRLGCCGAKQRTMLTSWLLLMQPELERGDSRVEPLQWSTVK